MQPQRTARAPSLVLLLTVLVPCVMAMTPSVGDDTAGSINRTCAANECLPADDWRDCVIRYVHHVIRSLGWKSVIVFAEVSSGAEDMASLLAEDGTAVTVFQWPLSTIVHQNCNDNNATSSRVSSKAKDDLNRTMNSHLSTHVLLLGSGAFVKGVVQEVLRINDFASLTFDWLAAVPRDQVSSTEVVAERLDNMAVVVEEPWFQLTLETIIRKRDATRLSTVTEWSPCRSSSFPTLTEDTVFPNKKYGLGGRTLKMVTMDWDPFIIRHENGSSRWYSGLCIDLLHMLASRLNFTYTIFEPTGDIWGAKLPNGTWIGMTGILHRKEADFALTGMSATAERATVTDFSQGFFFDELILMVRLPEPTLVGWTFFIRPFHWPVFLMLGCGFLLAMVMLALIDVWHSRLRFKQQEVVAGQGNEVPLMSSSLVRTAEVLFGTLLGRAVTFTGASTSGRVLLFAWLLLSLVAIATYSGKLTSGAVVTSQPLPFRTLGELVKRSDYTWGFNKRTMVEDFIANSTNKDYQEFYRKTLEFEKVDPEITTPTINKSLKENYVLLTSLSVLKFVQLDYCQLTMVRERLAQDTLAVAFQKGSPYKDMFDVILTQVRETGVLEHLVGKWYPEQSNCQTHGAQVMSVSLHQLPVAFLMAAGGLALSSGMLLMELLVRNNRCRRQVDSAQPACMPACCM